MQCDKTISHMVTAARSYFRIQRNACVTVGKINYGCFEMLSWPHIMSNNIINICFWLLDTCTKCSYFIRENIWPGAQRLAFEVKYEYIVHRSTNISCTGGLRLVNFQTTSVWSVKWFSVAGADFRWKQCVLGGLAGWKWARFFKFLQVWAGFKIYWCDMGEKCQPTQDSRKHCDANQMCSQENLVVPLIFAKVVAQLMLLVCVML